MSCRQEDPNSKNILPGRIFRLVMFLGSLQLPFLFCWGIWGCERRPLPSEKPDATVIAIVNGKPLFKEEFDVMLPEDYQRILTTEEKEEYLDRWISTELIYQEAMESGDRVTRDIEVRLQQYKKEMVSDRYLQKIIQELAVVSEEETQAYYQAHEYEYSKEFRVSHILSDTPEDAMKVQEELKKRSFSWVARRMSRDKHTGIGGDLGFLSKGSMIPAFEKIIFGMEEGEVSDIIESEFGYHIIKLTSIRDARNKLGFEDVKEEIANILMRRKREAVYDSLVTALRQKASIEIRDRELEWPAVQGSDSLFDAP